MTPQEKAKELVDMYLQYVEAFSSKQQDENAKQCALIAVNEILSISSNTKIVYTKVTADNWITELTEFYYWQEVKTEIEKL